ncbi:MAG: hypothetical protein U9N33_06605 [Campylobacterota bacterium]|nr:hypothetical protein [Campylobacterota bacterium]
MSKFMQALLTGMFYTFILDFFIFLGVKLHYIDFYNVDLYYNILFVDNQNIYIYIFVSLIIGFINTYIANIKITLIFIGSLFFISFSTLIPTVGHTVGGMMFMKKNITYNDAKYSYTGDQYYSGRDEITIYDYELKKTITLSKKDLKE